MRVCVSVVYARTVRRTRLCRCLGVEYGAWGGGGGRVVNSIVTGLGGGGAWRGEGIVLIGLCSLHCNKRASTVVLYIGTHRFVCTRAVVVSAINHMVNLKTLTVAPYVTAPCTNWTHPVGVVMSLYVLYRVGNRRVGYLRKTRA